MELEFLNQELLCWKTVRFLDTVAPDSAPVEERVGYRLRRCAFEFRQGRLPSPLRAQLRMTLIRW